MVSLQRWLSTPFAVSVSVEDRSGTLALVATSGSVHSLRLSGGEELGFLSETVAKGPIADVLEYGLLKLTVDGGAISMNAEVASVVDHGTDGVLSRSELAVGSARLAAQVLQTTSGNIDLSLPVVLNIPGAIVSGAPLLRAVDASPFDSTGPVIETVDFAEITQRNREAVKALRDGLSAIASFGGMLNRSGEFDVVLPAAGQALGELLDVEDIFQQTLVDPVAGYLDQFLDGLPGAETPTRDRVGDLLESAAPLIDGDLFRIVDKCRCTRRSRRVLAGIEHLGRAKERRNSRHRRTGRRL